MWPTVLSLMVLLICRWTYFCAHCQIFLTFQPLESTIVKEFILTVTGQSVNDLERDLFAFPIWIGRLGLCESTTTVDFELNSSVLVTSLLIHEIIQQCTHFSATVLSDQCQANADVVSSRHQQQGSRVSEFTLLLLDNLCCVVQLSSEKSASFWLSVLLTENHDFALHKGTFRDALCLWCGWLPAKWPSC